MNQYKTCTKCGQFLSLDLFSTSFDKRSNKSYTSSACRTCKNEQLRLWQRANKDKVALYARTFRAKHPEKCKQWRDDSAEIRNTKQRERAAIKRELTYDIRKAERAKKLKSKRAARLVQDKKCSHCKIELPRNGFYDDASRWDGKQAKCKACCSLLTGLWVLNNPGKASESRNRRRALMRNCDIRVVTAKDIRSLLAQPCAYCSKPSEHIDHIIPLKRNGRHSIGNLTGACASCNLSKGAKFITEWRKGN